MSFPQALRSARLRILIVAAALAVTGLLVSTTQIASARVAAAPVTPAASATGGAKPVIVLEHGAFADGSSWGPVVRILQRDGYTVYVPPNPLRGVTADSTYLKDFLTQNPNLAGKPIVLAGHSYGGFVMTNAAVGDSEVKALVYVDAFAPKRGDTVKSLTTAGSCLATTDPSTVFDSVSYPGGPAGDVDLYVKQSVFPGCFANGLPAREAADLAAGQRPLAASALEEPSGAPAWATIPSWDVIGTKDHVITPAEQLFMARRAHARITRVSAPHLSMLTDPCVVASVIERAAHAAG
jgi:pimeloyl-ACP methyl ester carboxylesterase